MCNSLYEEIKSTANKQSKELIKIIITIKIIIIPGFTCLEWSVGITYPIYKGKADNGGRSINKDTWYYVDKYDMFQTVYIFYCLRKIKYVDIEEHSKTIRRT